MPDDIDTSQAAAMLRGILDAVAEGGLSADGPAGAGLVRRIQGAVAALEVVGEQGSTPDE